MSGNLFLLDRSIFDCRKHFAMLFWSEPPLPSTLNWTASEPSRGGMERLITGQFLCAASAPAAPVLLNEHWLCTRRINHQTERILLGAQKGWLAILKSAVPRAADLPILD